MEIANSNGIVASTSLEEGIKKTMDWFKKNEKKLNNYRYNVFKNKKRF